MMINLYNLNDGLLYEKKMKLKLILIGIVSLIVALLITIITIFNHSVIIYIIDVLLTVFLLSYIYYYFAFERKCLKEAYLFLAKIQHYPLETINGTIISYSHETFLKWQKRFLKITLVEGRIIYIEADKINQFSKGNHYLFQLLENCVVGYQDEQ